MTSPFDRAACPPPLLPSPPSGWLAALATALTLAGCAEPQIKPSDTHLKQAPRPGTPPPALVTIPSAPAPKKAPRVETYSVVVNAISLRELLFALARDARIDVDIASDVDGSITMNAIDQTLPQLLERLSRQADMRWELDGKLLTVNRDTPFLRNYRVDYVNLKRETRSSTNISSQIVSGTGTGGGDAGNGSKVEISNTSTHSFWETLTKNITDLLRETDKQFPEGNAEEIVSAKTNQINAAPPPSSPSPAPPAAGAATPPGNALVPLAQQQSIGTVTRNKTTFREAASVIASPESGIIAVRATARQHERVKEFIDRVMHSARRQVLIEATIVEVSLNDQSQSGVDWKRLALGAGFSFRQNFLNNSLTQGSAPTIDQSVVNLISSIRGNNNLSPIQQSSLIEQIAQGMGTYPSIDPGTGEVVMGQFGAKVPSVYANDAFSGGKFPSTGDDRGITLGYGNGTNFAAALKLLNNYGRVKVISSPKVTALNNQTATLRVVNNLVYFNVSVTPGTTTGNVTTGATVTTTPQTVPIGFVMSVIPYIDDNHLVTLNVRPTISRLIRYIQDPNPSLKDTVQNRVPEIQTRELESVMKIPSGNIAMMGGLMEDQENRDSEGLPGLGDLPGIGKLFSARNSATSKTELVIFIRPVVITDPSLDGDYAFAKDMLPGKNFFNQPVERPIPGITPAPREDAE